MLNVCWSSKMFRKVQNIHGSLSNFLFFIIANKIVSLSKKENVFTLHWICGKIKNKYRLIFLLIPQTVFNYSALKLTCEIIKHKCEIDVEIIFNASAKQKREYHYDNEI